MARRSGLGKGLGAIFGEDVVESPVSEKINEIVSRETSDSQYGEKKSADQQEHPGKEYMMKLSIIEPNQDQPRKDFNEELIGELADSIKKYGVLQPLLVQKRREHYEIIACCFVYSFITTGTSLRPASFAALHRLSPAMIS